MCDTRHQLGDIGLTYSIYILHTTCDSRLIALLMAFPATMHACSSIRSENDRFIVTFKVPETASAATENDVLAIRHGVPGATSYRSMRIGPT